MNRSSLGVFDCGPAASEEALRLKVVRVTQHVEMVGTVLSERLIGLMTHYVDGRTQACIRNGCLHCLGGMMPRWKGYLHFALDGTPPREIALEVPAAAGEMIRLTQEAEGSLRGVRLSLRRVGNKVNGQVRVKVSSLRGDVEDLPELTLRPMLERIFGLAPVSRQIDAMPIRDEIAEHLC